MTGKDNKESWQASTEKFWTKDVEGFAERTMLSIKSYEKRQSRKRSIYKKSLVVGFAAAATILLYVNIETDDYDGVEEYLYIQEISREAMDYSREDDYVNLKF